MKATIRSHLLADSDDVVDCEGYHYFPRDAVRLDLLSKVERTARDLECPHSVQFYDVVVDGERFPRAAWSYEAPQQRKAQTAGRYAFWRDVTFG